MKTIVVATLVAASCAFGEELVYNGNFESVDSNGHVHDWNYPKESFKVDVSGGMNGTKALMFEGAADDYKTSIQQRVRVYPGRCYNFGCMIRTEKLEGKGLGARICLHFENQYGTSLVKGVYDTKKVVGTTGWTKSSGRARTPDGAYWVTVRVEVIGPRTGKAWFDDVYFHGDEVVPVEMVFSDCYRNEAADGEVRFGAGLNLQAIEAPVWPYTCTFNYVDDKGEAKSVKAPKVTELSAIVTLPVKGLKLGESEVVAVLSDGKGKEVGRSALKFTRLEKSVERKVTIDRRGRCIVDGKPFFPLGMYWSVPKGWHKFKLPLVEEEFVKIYADSPFNCTMPYNSPTRAQLDLLYKYGIKTIYCLQYKYQGDWDYTGKDEKRRYSPMAKSIIEEMRDHPGLLAWYLLDELSISEIEQIRGRGRTTRELDPDHPSWLCVYQYEDTRAYYQATDVMGTDPYPIPSDSLSSVYKWASFVRDSSCGLKPFWQVPQTFDWGTFRNPPNKNDRFPTEEEIKNMCWQDIAGGANGLICYSFTYLYQCTKISFDEAWPMVKRSLQMVKDNFDILLAGDEPPSFKVSGAVARTWREGNKVYALVVNSAAEAKEATFKVNGKAKYVKARFGTEPKVGADGTLAVELPRYGQAMYEFAE